MSKRENLRQKDRPVSLFVTCMADMLFPQIGIATVKILEHLGLEVIFPEKQTCCGQPGYNGGLVWSWKVNRH